MTDHCCDQGRKLVSALAFTERDLASAARKAAATAEARGQASERQLADIATFRNWKAQAADALADHEELCNL